MSPRGGESLWKEGGGVGMHSVPKLWALRVAFLSVLPGFLSPRHYDISASEWVLLLFLLFLHRDAKPVMLQWDTWKDVGSHTMSYLFATR